MAVNFVRIAVVYLVIGATLGLGMGIAQNFALAPVHAHVGLLGWATLALAGLVYHLYPAAATTRLARIHFWVHNLALPVFMGGLAAFLSGIAAALPVVEIGATAVLAGLVLFAVNVLVNVRSAA